MDDKQIEYLPFHAINEFMVNDFRLNVLGTVMSGIDHLSGGRRSAINNTLKRHIQVPGFRNSLLAPSMVKARAAVKTFETRPDFTAEVLQAWSELKSELRQKVYDFLKAREWELLPPDADRSKLPGFMVVWPKGESYDVLDAAYAEFAAGDKIDENDLRLMVVWLANRLPYDMYEDEDGEEDEEAGEE